MCGYFLIVLVQQLKSNHIIKKEHVKVEIKNKIEVGAWFNNTTTKIWGCPLKERLTKLQF